MSRAAMVLALGALLFVCGVAGAGRVSLDPAERFREAEERLAQASPGEERFAVVVDAAKRAADIGDLQKAEQYADEALRLAPAFSKKEDWGVGGWNYGNAIHDGHMVLGRVALASGDLPQAKEHLLAAGSTPGSPQLDSFGPNMTLARDLVVAGERDTVLQYFEECRVFWRMHRGRLDEWSADVKQGRVPDFGVHLEY